MKNITSNKEVINSVFTRVISLLERRKGTWEGTMSDLLTGISGRRAPEVFPGSASSLRRIVNKMVPAIRREGYRVEFLRTSDRARTRLVSFTRVTGNQ